MRKKIRRILFFISLILFILIGPTIVFYSQGYRFDLNPPVDGKKIVQTGGFFLKALPRQAEIYINEKFVKRTDLFFGSALIDNLLPKKYKITIKKEGYHLWEKELEIKEKEVTEAKNIILFPKNPVFNILTKNVEAFWSSPDEKKIALYEKGNSEEESWALKLYDLEKNIKSHLVDELSFISPLRSTREVDEKDISQKIAVDFLGLEWSTTSKEIYVKVGFEEKEKDFILKLEKIPPILTEKEIVQTPENVITSQDSYYLDKSGYIFKNGEKLNEKPFPLKEETKYNLKIFQNFIFLKENQTLYLFNFETKSFEKFFESVNNLKISPDNKKVVYFSSSEIWVLFLKESILGPQKKAGESVFLLRLSEKIGDVFWLNSDYLIFNSENRLKIAEIDDRDKINIVDIAEFKDPKIFWNQTDKKLYLLSEGELFVCERLF